MGKCETCGNEYANSFTVTVGETRHEFDSFECAIQKLAPRCGSCDCRIIGHGVEADGTTYCCAHCARGSGIDALRDSV